MLRVLIITVVALAVFVFFRLVLLSFTRPTRRVDAAPPTIEAKPRFNSPMTVRKFEFRRFELQAGPADPDDFSETVTLHAAPEGTDDISIYSVTVATPKALGQAVSVHPDGYTFQRNLIVVRRYDPAVIGRALHEHINEIAYLGEGG